jgi:aspartate/methionine/tyrosine aminotransferase
MGEPGLLRALVQFFNDYFDPVMEVKPEHIAIGPGASSCLGELVKALCQPGDCLLVPTPYWSEGINSWTYGLALLTLQYRRI